MYKIEILLASIFLIIVSFFGFSNPTTAFEWLFASYNGLDPFRIGLAALMIVFGVILPMGNMVVTNVLRVIGLIVVGVLLGAVLFPETYANLHIQLLSLDVVALGEAAVVSLLYSMNDQGDEQIISATYDANDPYLARPESTLHA